MSEDCKFDWQKTSDKGEYPEFENINIKALKKAIADSLGRTDIRFESVYVESKMDHIELRINMEVR